MIEILCCNEISLFELKYLECNLSNLLKWKCYFNAFRKETKKIPQDSTCTIPNISVQQTRNRYLTPNFHHLPKKIFTNFPKCEVINFCGFYLWKFCCKLWFLSLASTFLIRFSAAAAWFNGYGFNLLAVKQTEHFCVFQFRR